MVVPSELATEEVKEVEGDGLVQPLVVAGTKVINDVK